MTSPELREALRSKTVELEIAIETGRPHRELLRIYKELKELQFQLVHAELQFNGGTMATN